MQPQRARRSVTSVVVSLGKEEMTIGSDDRCGAHTEAGRRVLDLALADQGWMVKHLGQPLCTKVLLHVST